jgi:hypothetical protein
MTTKDRTITQVEAMYLANAANGIPRTYDYPVTYGSLDTYAWPGGYPIYYLDKRGDVLCPKCAQAILEARRADDLLLALGADGEFVRDEDEYGWHWERSDVLSAMRDAIGAESTRDVPTVYDVHYEGAPLTCEECQAEIESAYGDPDDESEED